MNTTDTYYILSEQQRTVLQDYFLFYNLLEESQKSIFEQRLAQFINIKHIKAAGFNLAEEIRILIAATAIKLTWGLDYYLFPHFHTVLVQAMLYYSNATQQFHYGEVRTDGIVVVNWQSLLQNLQQPELNYNITLHYFIHALYWEHHLSPVKVFAVQPENLSHWQRFAVGRINQERIGFPSSNAAYLESNFLNLFTACAEAFFETPLQLRTASPDVYRILMQIFNQDTLSMYYTRA